MKRLCVRWHTAPPLNCVGPRQSACKAEAASSNKTPRLDETTAHAVHQRHSPGVDAGFEDSGFFTPSSSRSELQASPLSKRHGTALFKMTAEDAPQKNPGAETVCCHYLDGVDTAHNGRARRVYRQIWPPCQAELRDCFDGPSWPNDTWRARR